MLPKTRKPEGSELSLPRQSEPPQACPMIETTVADDSELVSRPLNPCAPEQAQLLSGLAALVLHRQSTFYNPDPPFPTTDMTILTATAAATYFAMR